MVVRRLLGFMDRTPQLVDMIHEIKAQKEKSKKRPLIVINASGLISRFMSAFPAEQICGGRGQMLMKRVEKFCERLEKAGATLAFFTDCNVNYTFDVAQLIEKYEKHEKNHKAIYEALTRGTSLEEIAKSSYTHLNILNYDLVVGVLDKFGDVMPTTEAERDIKMARYAKENYAFAVMADKTDLIIFASVKRLWRPCTMKVEKDDKLEVTQWSQEKLLKIFSLNAGDQLALWATLVGNDFMHREFEIFVSQEKRFWAIAKYVKELGEDVEAIIPEVVDKIATEKNIMEKADQIKNCIIASLEYYRMNLQTNDQECDPQLLEQNLHYSILFNKPIAVHTVMDQQGDPCLPDLYAVKLEIFRKLMGVHLKNAEEQNATRKLFIRIDGRYELVDVEPIYPKFSVPKTSSLTSNCDTLDKDKVQILNFIFSMSWKLSDLMKLEPKLFSLWLTLEIMEIRIGIDKDEREIIWNCYKDLMQDMINDYIEAPRYLQRRTLQITFKLLNLYRLVNHILPAIGLKAFVCVLPLDGIHLHNKFESHFF